MALGLKFFQTNIGTGLQTYTATIQIAGVHYVSAVSSLPIGSNLVMVINKNGSPVATSNAVNANELTLQVTANISCSVSDVITVVLSSSATIDSLPNQVKTLVTINNNI